MFGRANAGYCVQELEIIAQHADRIINDFFSMLVVSGK
jgi:hypothetical protein